MNGEKLLIKKINDSFKLFFKMQICKLCETQRIPLLRTLLCIIYILNRIFMLTYHSVAYLYAD